MQHRDRIVLYQTLRMEDVYLSVAEDFPALKTQLVKILSQEASL